MKNSLTMMIRPLQNVPINSFIAALPKADIHVHQEEVARLERVIARRRDQSLYNWRESALHLIAETPPGISRLSAMYAPDAELDLTGIPADNPDFLIAKIVDVLEESAADGAILAEIRFGAGGQALMKPNFMALFREAERQVRLKYPQFYAEAIGFITLMNDPIQLRAAKRQLERCIKLANEGLAGIDFITVPYDTEAHPDLWGTLHLWAKRAANAGLGITVHAGEFSPANLAAALKIPGLRRLGHAVYAAASEKLMEQLVQSKITVECSLSCNVVLGAVTSYAEHPIRQFVASGIPVTLNTDDPVHIWTTIGREYAIASALGFSQTDLLEFTRNAVRASFTSAERRKQLLDEIDRWEYRASAPK